MNKVPLAKKILFLSGVDFKEKSIQVIKKTPEAYSKAGWQVHYVVGRDESVNGDYFYEPIINPPEIKIYRFSIPLGRLHGKFRSSLWKGFWFRVRNILLILRLFIMARRLLKEIDFDVVYGYEMPGAIALRFLSYVGALKEKKIVTRFQGVLYVKEWLRKKQFFRLLTNYDVLLALRTKADLCIMTNDGSQGTRVLQQLRSPNKNILFVSNGVEPPSVDQNVLQDVKTKFYNKNNCTYFLSVSRLDRHKRIDRGLRIIKEILLLGFKDIHFNIVGGGTELDLLKSFSDSLDLDEHITFIGPIKHDLVKHHFALADFFISMYTSTNVGNPLLEAISHNKIVVTLNNGDTGEWIQHFINGLIYSVDDDLDLDVQDYQKIAKDIVNVLENRDLFDTLKSNLLLVEKKKLWTWEERFTAELDEVNKILN